MARTEITPTWYEAGAAVRRHGALIAPTWDGFTQRETDLDAASLWASEGGFYSVLPCVPPADGSHSLHGSHGSHGSDGGRAWKGPTGRDSTGLCRQDAGSTFRRYHTDSGWIPVELGFMLWAVCPASRAGCRGGDPPTARPEITTTWSQSLFEKAGRPSRTGFQPVCLRASSPWHRLPGVGLEAPGQTGQWHCPTFQTGSQAMGPPIG